jgi:hypothetical protein
VARSDHNHDSTYWTLTGNTGTNPAVQFLGTADSQAMELRVNNGRALRLEPNDTCPNLIGGLSANSVTSGVYGATIGGGGGEAGSAYKNLVTDIYGTIGGGKSNQAGDNAGTTADAECATVGGGKNNYAMDYCATVAGGILNKAHMYCAVSGGYDNIADGLYSTIGGGEGNRTSANYATIAGGGTTVHINPAYGNRVTDDFGTVGGGGNNQAGDNAGTAANAAYSTASGGSGNTASGKYAAIPGGLDNVAQGDYSFAAGRRAKANYDGCFVWGDSTDDDIATSGPNRFSVRASGGVWFYSKSDKTTGVRLPANDSAWTTVSDRALKENIRQVDSREILSKLIQIPISRWSYKGQTPDIEHIGPMAQDFYAAFGLGDDERYISTIDPDGVALAAIQGLHEMLREKDKKISTLEARVEALETLVEKLVESQAGGEK